VLIAVLVDQRLPLGVVDFEHTSEDRERLLVALNAALQRIFLERHGRRIDVQLSLL
jgi:hypothetical protein